MVGARKATIYGRNMAREFASELTGYGIQIISGMAAGVDTSSHLGALDAGGYTAGVLGGGIDSIYPRENFNLYQKVCKTGGIISEYNVGIPSQKGMFPMRNRIISGMADGVFVVEAGERSGSLITADQGLEQGKLDMEKKESKNFKLQKFFCENENEEKIFNLIDKVRPVTFENLLENSDFSAFELQHILMKFELKNIIYQIEQNVYLRKI